MIQSPVNDLGLLQLSKKSGVGDKLYLPVQIGYRAGVDRHNYQFCIREFCYMRLMRKDGCQNSFFFGGQHLEKLFQTFASQLRMKIFK